MLSAARMNIHLSAAGIIPATTNGCGSPAASESSSNAVNWMGAEFADDADSHGWWGFGAPENWDGSIKIEKVCWSCSAGSAGDTVEWEIAAVGGGDGDDIDAALGTAVDVDAGRVPGGR